MSQRLKRSRKHDTDAGRPVESRWRVFSHTTPLRDTRRDSSSAPLSESRKHSETAVCSVGYLPSQLRLTITAATRGAAGSPSLQPLSSAGLALVSLPEAA